MSVGSDTKTLIVGVWRIKSFRVRCHQDVSHLALMASLFKLSISNEEKSFITLALERQHDVHVAGYDTGPHPVLLGQRRWKTRLSKPFG
jgi:hypothetical protein